CGGSFFRRSLGRSFFSGGVVSRSFFGSGVVSGFFFSRGLFGSGIIASRSGFDVARIDLREDFRIGRKFFGADREAVLVEEIGDDIGILLRRQAAGCVGRHGGRNE